MLHDSYDFPYQSYGFRFSGEQQQNIAGIDSVGWEKETDSDAYNWNGMERSETGKVIFQFTLNGLGKINITGKEFPLGPGDAFLVDLPSKHRYFLPKESKEWEFVFLTLYGEEAMRCFKMIKSKFGQILHLDSTSPPVKRIFYLIEKAANDDLQDAYESSAYAYSFLMNLISHIQHSQNKSWPNSVLKAVYFIQRHYSEPISLDDIVNETQISKYHLTRIFQQYTHMAPMKFVTKVRIEQALMLLKDNNLTIDEIAKKVGYANGNYFNKVFRSFIGVSPGKYRNGKTFLPFDRIITD